MDDNNQRSWKNRPQDSHSQAKRLEDLHTPQGRPPTSSTSIAAAPEVKLVNADILRHYYSTVCTSEKAGPSKTSNPVASQVKMQPGTAVYHSGITGQVVMVKSEKVEAFSPAGESLPTPSHTTKSSSLSRDISPSRITAQVVSAMSESSQPLLLSALTGKMPTPVILSSKSGQDRKQKQLEVPVRGSSPYQVPERRHSPLQADSRTPSDSKGAKRHPVSSVQPFESLMQAAALMQAQELQGQSSPGHLSVVHQQGSVSMHNEGRTRTPSPKSASLSVSRSPQRPGGLQVQRRSPMAPGSRPSPVPSPAQEGVTVLSSTAALSGGVMFPVQQMGLVQQHLLAATIASTTSTTTTTTTTTTTASSHSRSGSVVPAQNTQHPRSTSSLQAHTVQHTRVATAPPVPSLQPSVQLTAIPMDMSAVTTHRVRSTKNSHVISIGTETELRQYASHGAQTKLKSEEKVKVKEETIKGLVFRSPKKDKVTKVSDGAAGNVLNTLASVSVASRLAQSVQGGTVVSTVSQTVSDSVAISEARTSGRACGTVSSFSPLSSTTLYINSSLTHAGVDQRKWHVPVPTAAHGNKPIPVPSSHAHVHVHPPHSLPQPRASVPVLTKPHVPATSASSVAATVNSVCSAPLTQPTVSLSHHPVTTTHIQPTTVGLKSEPKPVLGTVLKTEPASSLGQTASSVHYQPHHHRYQQESPPAQTITSQTVSKSGPVVKDFIPVLCSPEPPPYHQPPLPSHINPFTFPTSGVKVHDALDNGPAYSLIKEDSDSSASQKGSETKGLQRLVPTFTSSCKSVSDVSVFRKVDKQEEMPRLTPEGSLPIKCEALPSAANLNMEATKPGDTKERPTNPFNQRLQNLNNFPSVATAYRSAYRSQSVAMQRAKAGITTSAAKSLDILRQNIQKSVNKELDQIVRRYVEKFFKPAAENIRLNNGTDAVSEEHLNTVCRQMFEEAKKMYSSEGRRSLTPIADFSDNVSESGSLNGKRVSPTPLSKRLKASDSDSEKGSDGGLPKKVPRRKGRPPLNSSGRSTPLKPVIKLDSMREGPKWDPERIKPETLFVMGARANKALGLGNTRGRLYIRHPDVFKYSGDQEDKVWLHDQKLLPATGGKAYLLIVEDIVDLSKTEEYRDSPTLMMHECRGFEVPEWMRIKIKESMRAMRADSLKRSRSRSPLGDRPEPPKSLPFASFSDTASNNDVDSIGNKNSLQPSPADTEEMEFLSAMENDDTQPSDISPFKMTAGFEDTSSQSPCPPESMDDEPSVAVPLTNSLSASNSCPQ